MARTRITADRNNVTIERDDPFSGERTSTTYFVPYSSDGHAMYVRIRDAAGHYPQVCDHLYGTGSTLMATPDTLAAVIRRELRARQRDEARDLANR